MHPDATRHARRNDARVGARRTGRFSAIGRMDRPSWYPGGDAASCHSTPTGPVSAAAGGRPAGSASIERTKRAEAGPVDSATPDRGFAVAAVEQAPLVLHPLGAARAALGRAGEGPRDAAGAGTGLRAVLRGDVDRRVAAVTLARVDPAR